MIWGVIKLFIARCKNIHRTMPLLKRCIQCVQVHVCLCMMLLVIGYSFQVLNGQSIVKYIDG